MFGLLASSVCGSVLALDAYGRERRTEGSALPALLAAVGTRTVSAREALREGVQVGLVRNVDSLGVQTLPTIILGSLGDPRWVDEGNVNAINTGRASDVIKLAAKQI